MLGAIEGLEEEQKYSRVSAISRMSFGDDRSSLRGTRVDETSFS